MNRADLQRAAACCRAGRCGEAIDVLEAAVRLEPANPELFHRLGLCYSGGCRRHPLASPALARAYLRHALELAGGAADPLARTRILDTLGHACFLEHRFEEAAECHAQAAAGYRAAGETVDWAREEFNLANVCCELGRWGEAIRHYRNALEVRTRERDPRRWAAVMDNLGTAYRQARRPMEAIGCYRRALRVYRAATFPAEHAAVHNNLGNVYLSLAGDRNARRALRHLNRALAGRSRSAAPAEYAVAQYNRGHAYARLRLPGYAAACFLDARDCFLAAGQPAQAELALRELERNAPALRPAS